MADKRNDELEEVKRFVRSVLQSEKNGIPLRRFERDYHDLVGESVPFRRLGFRSVIEFIAAIGDTARFDFRHNEQYVSFVSSHKTAHIEELIRGQKSCTPKSARNRHTFSSNFNRGYYKAPKPKINFSPHRYDSANNGMHYANPPLSKNRPNYEPCVAVSRQQNNHMRNTPPSQSYQAYRQPVVSTQSSPISRTTSNTMQSNSYHKTGNNRFENFTVTRDVSNAEKSPLRVNTNEVESVLAVITTANSTLTITTITTTATAVTISSATIRPTHVNSNTTTTTAATVTPILSTTITRASESPQSLASQHMSPNSNGDDEAEEDELNSDPTPPSSPLFSSIAVLNIRQILSQHKDGIPMCLFAREYRKRFGVEFDSNVWGFKSAMEMFHSLTSVFAIQQPTPANENLFPGYGEEIFLHDARHKQFSVSKPKSTTDAVDLPYLSTIPDKVMAQTLKLIELNMPQGLSLTLFTEEYRINFGDIKLSQMGIPDTCQYFKHVQQVLPIEVQMIDGTKRAFLKSATDVEAFLCRTTRVGRHIFAKTMISGSLPAEVAMPGDVFADLELPPHLTVGDSQYAAVLLTSAKDPSDLYIQFKGDDYHTALEKLMADLDFYNTLTNTDDWIVPKAFLCVGLPVVTKFSVDGHWHRARITQILGERFIRLSFIDYGGITITSIKNVLLMKRQFLRLPMQGLRVSVYGVKPALAKKRWTANARDDLLDRFSKSNYYLACTFVEKIRSDYYSVCLCDTNDADDDVFVHEYLVQQQHAVYEDIVADSNGICAQEMAIQTSLTANQTLPVIEESLEEQKIIDGVNDEEVENGVQPLIPQLVSTIDSPEPVISLINDYNLGVNYDELRQTAEQVINEANPSQPSIQPSVANHSTPKKLVSNITITSNLNTGERKIVNGSALKVRNLSILNNLSLTRADSELDDDRNKSDVQLTSKVYDKLDSDSIIGAKLKAVLIGSQSYNLIYFMDSFYFTYSSVNEMFKGVPLWMTIRRSGGLLKDRIHLGESDGRKLFSHLNIIDNLRNGTAFLYPHESVASFAALNKLRPIRDEINSNVNLFYKEILVDEHNKLLEKQRNIENKLKNLKL